jgi:dTDP-4-dehydrorhamnose 3,5-epimerase
MKIIPTDIEGVVVVEPRRYGDDRGYFMETFHQHRYGQSGMGQPFVQDNFSFSVKNTLRGLHFQIRRPQAKLVQVLSGTIFDVVVDLRSGSPTFGRWTGLTLSEDNGRQLFIPKGFAHGFCVLSDTARFIYKCSDVYLPEDEGGVLWSDTAIGIDWPVTDPILSEKDAAFPCLGDVPPHRLPGRDRGL